MRIAFFHSDKQREIDLSTSFLRGAKQFGHQGERRRLSPNVKIGDCDLACMVGVKSKRLWYAHRELGIDTLLFDKGYCRQKVKGGFCEYWRLSLNDHHPTETTLMAFKYSSDRFNRLEVDVKPWRQSGDHIILAGSSAKYHDFYNLKDPTFYNQKIVYRIKKYAHMPIVYRPKPSWREYLEIPDTIHSFPKDPLMPLLDNAYCLVTHGSNVCFESIVNGIPCIITGNGIAKPISTSKISDIHQLPLNNRDQWLVNIAYHQWTEHEMRSGECWNTVKEWLWLEAMNEN